MSTLSGSEEKLRLEDLQHYDPEDISYCSLERADSPTLRGHHGAMEQEKRIRREIANSNERRRMQSINAGFQSLRTLLPHHEGEKLSKAAILQQTAEYIYTLEQEKTRLLSQNCQLKRLINQHEGEASSAAKKRKTETGMVVVSDEAKAAAGSPPTLLDLDQPELIDLRVQLDRERGLRLILEDQVRSLETQLYPERIREITQQVQLQYQHEGDEETSSALDASQPSESPVEAMAEAQQVEEPEQPTLTALQVSLHPVSHTETVIATTSPSPPSTPAPPVPVAVKVEPTPANDAHDERLPSPATPTPAPTVTEEVVPQARVYLASTSRQNLETIVEAIRHLEGDAFIDSTEESGAPAAPAPTLAPVPAPALTLTKQQRLLNPFLQFHAPQQRPGVIVVKQHT